MSLRYFFYNATASTEIYTLSLHDALPISVRADEADALAFGLNLVSDGRHVVLPAEATGMADRKSTRLNSSHPSISYAVFCLKKKNSPQACSSLPTMAVTRHLCA